MYRVMEEMLVDGEPNLPFSFQWANEPWSRRWTGTDDGVDDVLLVQDYGDEADWLKHYVYLSRFFDHPKYIHVQGRPIFGIYRIGHIGEVLPRMLAAWGRFAQARGKPIPLIVENVGSFWNIDRQWEYKGYVEAAMHFWPAAAQYTSEDQASSTHNMDILDPKVIQYWGAVAGFFNGPRHQEGEHGYSHLIISPHEFGAAVSASFGSMSRAIPYRPNQNLYFLTAWNEWNEQAILEPDNVYGFAYLDALRAAVNSVPVRPVVY